MRAYYLWLIPCLQIALITAAGDESEHVHIKVHMPDTTRKHRVRHHQYRKQQQHPNVQQFHHHTSKRPLQSTKATYSIQPYEFDVYGLEEAVRGKNLIPEELTSSAENVGPVVFNNDILSSTVDTQHPSMISSKQMMRHLFTPEMMSLITSKEELNDVNSHVGPSLSSRPIHAVEGSDLFSKYLQQFNKQQQQQQSDITGQKFSSKTSKKRKKNINSEIGDQRTIAQQHRKPQQKQEDEQLDFEPYYTSTSKARNPNSQYQTHRQQQIGHPNFQQFSNTLHWTDDDNSDEFETAEDISSESNEDMTTAFNKLQPISYQDMFGEYATPFTSTTAQHGQSYHQQTTLPSYSHPGNWQQYHNHNQQHHYQEQYQHQRPEVQQQQRHHKQKQKQKQKSQQTQFVLPSTTLRHTPSTSSSSSSLSSLSATSPISNGFTGGSITSTGTLPWILPYEFVQKSQQQQLHQQLEAQQYQHKPQKLPSHKKRKNRNKPKRNRIVVK